jgi:DNA repair photolyase
MRNCKLIKVDRKSPILGLPDFGCLKGVPAINITRGCVHSCVYCYARGFTDAPPKGEVYLYKNLPVMLERELERKKKIPSWVSFSTASDAFQDIDEVLETTYASMKLLLDMNIGISFLTKGVIPYNFIKLFKSKSHLIKARVGIVSFNEEYWRFFEPWTAHPLRRLQNIRNLINAGIDVSVRIDPVIPLPSVDGGVEGVAIEHLIKRIRVSGVRDISVSHLVMRPSIVNQFMSELPVKLASEIINLYKGQSWQRVITSARTKLLPRGLRIGQLQEIKEIATRYGIRCYTCGCKNPDLEREPCNPWVEKEEIFNKPREQMVLF